MYCKKVLGDGVKYFTEKGKMTKGIKTVWEQTLESIGLGTKATIRDVFTKSL